MQHFHTLPEDRQRLMKKAFRDLREYPPEQRQAMMNSGQFQAQFTPQERGILGNILLSRRPPAECRRACGPGNRVVTRESGTETAHGFRQSPYR